MAKNKQSGLSIIEIPIALFIVGVTLLIYAASSNSAVLNKEARYQELANRIASSEMEDLRNDGYTNVPASGSFSNSLLSQLPSNSAVLTVSDYNADTKQVVVKVSWLSANGTTHNISLTTLITKSGL